MKANRKFVEDKEAVSAVIGVILMVAITVAIAATVYVYVSGMLGSGPETNAIVTMSQSGDFILVAQVQGGPLTALDCDVSWIAQADGSVDAGTIVQGVALDLLLDGGDSLPESVAAAAGSAGDKWTVNLLYGGDVVGTCVYTVQ